MPKGFESAVATQLMEYPQRQAYHSGFRTDQIATPLSFNASIPQGPSEVSKPFR